jgi:zinc transporter ZupT
MGCPYGLIDREVKDGQVGSGAIGFHSFLDGVIYSITFEVGFFTGVLTAIGTILHEFPEGVITFVLRQQAGYGHKKAILYAFLRESLNEST